VICAIANHIRVGAITIYGTCKCSLSLTMSNKIFRFADDAGRNVPAELRLMQQASGWRRAVRARTIP
jgi:hypothetical protein